MTPASETAKIDSSAMDGSFTSRKRKRILSRLDISKRDALIWVDATLRFLWEHLLSPDRPDDLWRGPHWAAFGKVEAEMKGIDLGRWMDSALRDLRHVHPSTIF